MNPDVHMNILKFGYNISYKYKRYPSHSIDRFHAVTIFKLLKLSIITMIFKRFSVDHYSCDYLSP